VGEYATPLLLALLNLLVSIVGMYLRSAFKEVIRRLDLIEEEHRRHLTWHLGDRPDTR